MQWETVIGLEVHVQLATKSKIFCGSATNFGAEPNTQTCEIDLAMPGSLPVLNKEAVHMAAQFGCAVGAKVSERCIFDRKNYFYPDSPKGYQISQDKFPIVGPGHLDVVLENGDTKRIGIHHAHLEEDAGKSLHGNFNGMTGIDLNRAGIPLLEIVSDPDMRSSKEAIAYAKALRAIVRYLGISDGNMQEGSLRCDVNVSVRPQGQAELGTRTELKNINSFRSIERAVAYEVERQIELIESGKTVEQETRLYDADKNETRAMRSKENANDYRYFPDPDLLPVLIEESYIAEIKKNLPELPQQKRERFKIDFQLTEYDADILTAEPELAFYFEEVVKISNIEAKLAANWISSELLGALNKNSLRFSDNPISTKQLAQLLQRITDNTISGKIAKDVFALMWQEGSMPDKIIEQKGLKQITDTGEIEKIIDDIIANNPAQVEQYRAGKEKVFGFFVGQTMKASQGKANPEQVNTLLKKKLT